MRRLWVFFIVSIAIAGCSGGGGGGGPAPTPSTPGPVSSTMTPTATPMPTPTPTATPASASVTGKVFDYDSGSPIVGATVSLGGVTATTDATGSWLISNAPTDLQYFQVSASGYATYNSGLTVVAPMTSARAVKLIKPTTEEQNTLAQMNSFRSQNGAGPVAFDEVAMEVSRAHAQEMAAQGYFSHWDTTGLKPYQRYAADGGVAESDENLALGTSNWAAAENGFEAEKASNGGHYQTLVEPTANWTGLGEVENASMLSGARFDQELVTIGAVFDPTTISPIHPGSSLTIKFRVVGTNAPTYGAYGIDPLPTPLTPSQLNQSPYNGDYPAPNPIAVNFTAMALPNFSISVTANQAGNYYIGPVGGKLLLSWVELAVK